MADNAEKAQQEAPAASRRAIFRIPAIATLAIFLLTVCITPVAFTVPGMLVLYVIPVALAVWVLRVRTVADADGLAIRTLRGNRRLSWSELKGFALTKKGKVRAVTADGEEIELPTVRTRHLPVLSVVSNGRVPDPSGAAKEFTEDSEDSEDSTDPAGTDPPKDTGKQE